MKGKRMAVLSVVVANMLVVVALAALGAGQAGGAGAAGLDTAPRQVVTQTVNLAPSKDNTLYESELGTLSNGKGEYLFAGNNNNGAARRAVLAFDVAGALPAGATVITAELTLRMSKGQLGAPPAAVSLHALQKAWGEGASDAIGEEGAGALAQTGDATWLHSFFDTATWAQPGGDFGAALATTIVGQPDTYTWASAALSADVQAALDSPANHYGWLLLGDESGNGAARRFDSRENATVADRPRLTITYSAEAAAAQRAFVPVVMR